MKVTAIRITKGVTIYTGKFEAVRADVSLNAILEDGETLEDAKRVLSEEVTVALIEELKPTLQAMTYFNAESALVLQLGMTPEEADEVLMFHPEAALQNG